MKALDEICRLGTNSQVPDKKCLCNIFSSGVVGQSVKLSLRTYDLVSQGQKEEWVRRVWHDDKYLSHLYLPT